MQDKVVTQSVAEQRMKKAKFTQVGQGWDGRRTRYVFNFTSYSASLI